MKITIEADQITVFHDHLEWVNKAQSRLSGFRQDQKIICVDRNGNACTIGQDFRVAKENDLFPVTAYRLVRTSEICYDNENPYMLSGEELDRAVSHRIANGR